MLDIFPGYSFLGPYCGDSKFICAIQDGEILKINERIEGIKQEIIISKNEFYEIKRGKEVFIEHSGGSIFWEEKKYRTESGHFAYEGLDLQKDFISFKFFLGVGKYRRGDIIASFAYSTKQKDSFLSSECLHVPKITNPSESIFSEYKTKFLIHLEGLEEIEENKISSEKTRLDSEQILKEKLNISKKEGEEQEKRRKEQEAEAFNKAEKLRLDRENEALKRRLEIENAAEKERQRIETEALENRLKIQTEALEKEKALTLEILNMRAQIESQDMKGTADTTALLMELLKSKK